MTAAVALPAIAAVEQLEADTRNDLSSAIDNLARLREIDAHLVRGFDTWHGYVVDRFGDLLARLRLPRAERVALAGSMDAAGMPVRDIAEKLGVSLGTAQNYRRELGKVIPLGPRRGTEPEPAPTGHVYEQAAEWLGRHPDGLTLVELAAAAGWTEGKASGALTDVLRRGLAVRVEDRRAGQRIHLSVSPRDASAPL